MSATSHILYLAFVRAAKKTMAKTDAIHKSAIVIETLRGRLEHVPVSPLQAGANFPIRLLLELSRINIAFEAALRSQGFTQSVSSAIIEDTNWRLARPGIRALTLMLRLARRNPAQITHTSNAFLWSYIFRNPFQKTDIETPAEHEAVVSYNVTACPMQTYYHSQSAAHVCRAAACQLDHRMAREWGVSFQRTQTLAEGADHCDFRFHTKEPSCALHK